MRPMRTFFLILLWLVAVTAVIVGALAVGLRSWPPRRVVAERPVVAPPVAPERRFIRITPDDERFSRFALKDLVPESRRSQLPNASFHNGSPWRVLWVTVEFANAAEAREFAFSMDVSPDDTAELSMFLVDKVFPHFQACRLKSVLVDLKNSIPRRHRRQHQ